MIKPAKPGTSKGKEKTAPAMSPLMAKVHDPLGLIKETMPDQYKRLVLWSLSVLVLAMIVWAMIGKLDIVVTAEGRLVPKTLVKIVQPAESGIVAELFVAEGDRVKEGQVLVTLDSTVASADKIQAVKDLGYLLLQERRIHGELQGRPIKFDKDDDPDTFSAAQAQYNAHIQKLNAAMDLARSLLIKAENEHRSALQIQYKLEQGLPLYQHTASVYVEMQKQGFFSPLAAAEKQRDATEKAYELEAQKLLVKSLEASVNSEKKRIDELVGTYRSDLENESVAIKSKIIQQKMVLEKNAYREGKMALKAPQDSVVKDLLVTSAGTVVQPGEVILTVVPDNERLYADVWINNEDVGFVEIGHDVVVKVYAYPFQRYGTLRGKIIRLGADAEDQNSASYKVQPRQDTTLTYKARVELIDTFLDNPEGGQLHLSSGMGVIAEIHQGRRSIMAYLLSSIKKVVNEAGKER